MAVGGRARRRRWAAAAGAGRWRGLRAAWLAAALGCARLGGGPQAAPAALPAPLPADALALPLIDTDGRRTSLQALRAGRAAVALVFFSASCPCQAAHDARLRALAAAWAARGVRLVAIDPEFGRTPAQAADEARLRAYRHPLLLDPGGRLAAALGAAFATDAVLLDGAGRVRFVGSVDADGSALHPDARPYLTEAVEAVLAGRPPPLRRAPSVGCPLRRW